MMGPTQTPKQRISKIMMVGQELENVLATRCLKSQGQEDVDLNCRPLYAVMA
jgi:hypothetical protein